MKINGALNNNCVEIFIDVRKKKFLLGAGKLTNT
jgi:hypothetical protein